MSRGRLTRRDVLRGAAVAGAAALVDPGGALARTPGPSGVFSRWVGTLAGGDTPPLTAPGPFVLVGVEWSAPARANIELRTRYGAPWATASLQGHGPDGTAEGHARERTSETGRRFGEPIWTDRATWVQLRSDGPVRGVRLHFVSAAGAGAGLAHAATALPLAQPILEAGPGQPPIIARSAWAHAHARPRHVPEYGTVKLAFVHHSETPNGYGAGQVPSILYSIFVYHRYVRGYFDIGYNFAVDALGGIWEARAGGIDQAVMGAQAGGYNTQSTGVVVLGSFMATAPSPAALDALGRLLAWKLSLHGVPALGRVTAVVDTSGASYTAFAPGAQVSLPRIAGHRDGDQTSCPGDALYARLPPLRLRVAQLAGAVSRLTIAAPVAPVSPGSVVAVTGQLTDLATGVPVAGAPVEIQQLTGPGPPETTLATLTTDEAGGWTYSLTPTQNTLLRALHRSAPAVVSDVVVLSVAPVVTLSLASEAPVIVSGTVNPAGARVTLDLYQVIAPGRRRLRMAKPVAAVGGTFRARIKRPRPGRYVVIARTPAGARYAAGASTPVAVTIGA